MNRLNVFGFVLGFVMLLLTGLGHIFVIKGEYYFGAKLWPLFLIFGLLSITASFFVRSDLLSGILGIVGCIYLWSIHELFRQKERVRRGWFPENPDRKI
ncbi:MAG: DUF4491 domain-containing protein [Candidatus Latescibacterota bacterium]|nr:MAG: DUF4491 domain-containing protein [Candidatus Latescibacterota bacterium]